MKKTLLLFLVCICGLKTSGLFATISGSGIVGGAIAAGSMGDETPQKINTGTKEELRWLRNRVKQLSEENKNLKDSRSRIMRRKKNNKKKKEISKKSLSKKVGFFK